MRNKKQWSILLILVLLLQLVSYAVPISKAAAEDAGKIVTLVGDLQSELGHTGDWDPAAAVTKMKNLGNGLYEFKGTLPAGSYQYKIAVGGSWDENYGKDGKSGGDNISLSLSESKEVTFYYNDATHKIADSTWYTAIAADKLPRLAGTIQPAIKAGDEWSPGTSTAILTDADFDGVYTLKTTVPKGKYEFKVVLGNNWGEQYPGDNMQLNVLSDSEITFSFNSETKAVLTDYNPGVSDGQIAKDKLFHNTWEAAYRQPFGAVPAGQEVTLRLAAKKGDLTRASLQVKNYLTGSTKVVKMKYAGWTDVVGQGPTEFWEAAFTPEQKGVHGYKFIVGDGAAVAEYGEDTTEGGTGAAADANAGLFQLTVYDPSYKTPDWMKEAVVYQIFPDRFFNGNTSNDHAKDEQGARGSQPIEHPKSWNTLPDNPRIKENNLGPYDGDGEWSNDFFGGDIAGVQKKLDYLQSLGVNTLYLNPIAEAASNHKYDATDYKAIDPMFGSPAEFEAFVKELEQRHMHLILDGVFNHVADDSVYFDRYHKYNTVGAYEYWSAVYDLMNDKKMSEADAKAAAEKKFKDEGQEFSPYGFHNWFNIQNEKVEAGTKNEHYKYQGWWGYDSLPEIKSVPGTAVNHDSELNNTPFANYIFRDSDSVAKSWIERGSSGWRLDVANEVDEEFWRQFRQDLKTKMVGEGATLQPGEAPLILGEIWDDASKYFVGDQYDSVMNYRFRGAVLDFLKNGKAENANNQLTAIQEDYPRESFYALMNLMGSHDTARAVFLLGNGTDNAERAEWDKNYNYELGKQRLKLAATLQMGYAGAPTIYYGDEAGVTGSKDPDDRRTYPWGNEDKDLIAYYQAIGKVRTQHADLFANGELKHVYAKGDVLAYARTNGKDAAIVVVNRGSSEQTVEIPVAAFANSGVAFTDELQQAYKATSENGVLKVTVGAMQGRMLTAGLDVQAPAAVTDLKAAEQSKEASLTWSGNAVKYCIYQSNISGALFKKIGETTEKSFQATGLDNGRSYYFAVAAVDANGNPSKLAETKEVIPHYDLGAASVKVLTQLENGTLDLSKANTVQAAIELAGATEQGQAEGMTAQLEVQAPGLDQPEVFTASYSHQDGAKNVFQSSFRAFAAGQYTYRFAFSSDNGRTWSKTDAYKVTLTKDTADTEQPAAAVELQQPVQESGQVNLHWSLTNKKDPFLTTITRDGAVIAVLDDGNAATYRDYEVANGKTYKYQVHVYDKAGNTTASKEVSVTPDIVMVQVTFKVNAPAYTPLTEKITMPGSANGWNNGAWEMSRNGAVTPDWEYTVELQEGTEVTYKYVKGSSWDQEGLPDHTPGNAGDDDVSLYGYGAIGTDMKVIVQNQGGNKMVVQDKILRWIDQPVVITSPVNGTVTDGDTVEVKGNAIKGGNLTIGGEKVAIRDDLTFSHQVKLQPGKNDIEVDIEPSEDSKTNIFKGDAGAIDKNTKKLVLSVERSGGTTEPEDGVVTVNPATTVTDGTMTAAVTDEHAAAVKNGGTLHVEPKNAKEQKQLVIAFPSSVLAKLIEQGADLLVDKGDTALSIPTAVLAQLKEAAGGQDVKISMHKLTAQGAIGPVYDFSILAGKTTVHEFKEEIHLFFNTGKVEGVAAKDVAVAYYNPESKKWELQDSTYDEESGVAAAAVKHFSTYGVVNAAKADGTGAPDQGGTPGKDPGTKPGQEGNPGTGTTPDQGSTPGKGTGTTAPTTGPVAEEGKDNLPDTATMTFNLLLLGAALTGAGVLVYRRKAAK
ncbi:pullulanase X25 domain-containing protein [Ectobacillus ponti]|uniref:Alpha-amylase family glycosyl hydrolase n=1 Tax=Ectobacillus ponti TaxID=2961894 RepID=A0AA42BRC2_9BACI|nr:alpha-amylase family glycosyl hydrolase [Ectobacillus ponti]MCP8969339.1 alpha-amylase family glycosyl hydrolase [Ectobacillus ponti]